jgi:hypothetical protein
MLYDNLPVLIGYFRIVTTLWDSNKQQLSSSYLSSLGYSGSPQDCLVNHKVLTGELMENKSSLEYGKFGSDICIPVSYEICSCNSFSIHSHCFGKVECSCCLNCYKHVR